MADELNFVYSLEVNRLTGPAGEAARALGTLNTRLEACARAIAKIDGLPAVGLQRLVKATEQASNSTIKYEQVSARAGSRSVDSARKIADEWEKMAARADRAEQRKAAAVERGNAALNRAHAQAIAMDARRTAAQDREAAKRAAAAERESARATAQEARDEQRFSAYRLRLDRKFAREREAAAEKNAHKSYFGGEKSLGDLFRSRAESKTSGMVTGAVDAVLNAPAAAISGAFSLVTSAVSAGASLSYSFGRMAIDSQAMRENSVAAFASIYGSVDVGNQLFDKARKIGQLTKFETKDVVGIYNTLAANNFKSDELEKYGWAVADIASARGSEKGLQFLAAIGKIRSSKTATFGTLQSAGGAGPGAENVFSALGEITGKGEMGRAQWQKYLRGNTVTRDQALEAVLKATTGTYDKKTGKLGDFAREQGMGTWEGLISNIGEGLGNTLRGKSISDLPALKTFKTLLQSINELFDESTENGKRFTALVGRFVEDVFIPFGGLEGKGGSILTRLLDAGDAVEKKFRQIMEDIKSGVKEAFSDDGAGISQLAAKVGFAIGSGIFKGIMSELPGSRYSSTVQGSAGAAWGNLVEDTIGGATVEGMPLPMAGKFATGGEVPGPYGSPQLAIVHGGEIISGLQGEYAGATAAKYGGGGSSFNVTVNVMGGGDSRDVADAVVSAFEMAVRNPSALSVPG